MKSIALRFGEMFAPECGTISAHQQVFDRHGFVWYGKLGNPISRSVEREILSQSDPKILLIHSGGVERYWLSVEDIQRKTPELAYVPSYYRAQAEDFGCWFKVVGIERADKAVMSKCVVRSSGRPLSLASRHSMSPYFIIDYHED